MTVYNFILLDADDQLVMTTQVDEPNPMIDSEFWETFMRGEYVMLHTGTSKEDSDE